MPPIPLIFIIASPGNGGGAESGSAPGMVMAMSEFVGFDGDKPCFDLYEPAPNADQPKAPDLNLYMLPIFIYSDISQPRPPRTALNRYILFDTVHHMWPAGLAG